ncbi:MAG: hypothetical protein Fur0020_03390 [Thermodesulfovibrionia bacterium]
MSHEMKRVIFLTSDDARYGFMLAGADQCIVRRGDVIDELNKITRMEDIGIIVVDERLLSEKDFEDLRGIEKRYNGVILVLPAPMKIEGEDYAVGLIKSAIGYHVRLNQ